MQPDEMVDQLGAVLGKYEVPMGLMNKCKSRSLYIPKLIATLSVV
jgi:hypothetical protein